MKKLYRNTKRGVAFVLAGLLMFMSAFVHLKIQSRAEGDDPPGAPSITVCSYDSSECLVEYISGYAPGEDENAGWNPVWESVSASGETVSGFGVRISPVGEHSITSVVTTPESFQDYDPDTQQNITLNIGDELAGGNPMFFNSDNCPSCSITAITVGGAPQPCQLSVESYDNTYGKIYYTADLNGDNNWVEVGSSGTTSAVSAFRVKGVPVSGNYTVSYTLNNSTNITDDGDKGLRPEVGTNTVTNIVFAERSAGDPGNGGNPVIQIQAESYTATNGKMQYSADGTNWTDIPAAGLGATDAGFVRAVPAEGYNVSYRIDGNVVTDTNSHGLSGNPAMHWIEDISFTLNAKNLTVAAYNGTYGTIQYSLNGTDWENASTAGETVQALYVRATAAANAVLDSYRLGNSDRENQNTVISTGATQTLRYDNNTVDNISFLASGGTGGKYTINITNEGGINAPTTIKFLDSSNAALATVSSGTEQEIPVNTAKIRIEVAGHHELLQTMQIERKDKDAASYEHGTELAGRIAMEASIINDGYAEFAASAGYSYVINITFSNAKNVRWRYPEDRNHGDTSEDEIVENAKLYRLLATSDDNIDVTRYSQDKDQMLTIGQTYYFLLVPDYGYQVSSLQINDGPLMAPISGDTNMGVFKFTMTNSNFHFKGIVSPANDIIVENSNAVSGATIADGANATSVGNVRMTVSDKTLDASAAGYAGEGATAVATVDIDLEQVVSKGGSNGYWSKTLTVTTGDVTVGLAVPASGLAAGETYSVVRNHDGTRTKLNATYNSTTQMLEFPSNQFSDYTIVKVPGTPATDSAPAAKEETKQESSESSSGNDDNDDSNSGSTAKTVASTLGSIVDKTATGGLASKTVIKDWNDLNNVLLKDNANNAAVKNNKKVLSDKQKAKGELVQVVLNKKDATIPDSTFDSLYKSDKSGLHVFVANGTALTFINNRQLRNQKALDLTCNVTSANGSKIISFKTYAKLKAKTMLHTTVPAGVKTVTVYKYDAKGNRKYFGKLKPTAEGRVCFGVTELTKYELVYNY